MARKLRVIFGDTIRGLHGLWLEVIGAFFLALALFGIGSVVQEYRRWTADPETGIWRLSMSVLFVVSFLGFGLHSFWRARRVRQ